MTDEPNITLIVLAGVGHAVRARLTHGPNGEFIHSVEFVPSRAQTAAAVSELADHVSLLDPRALRTVLDDGIKHFHRTGTWLETDFIGEDVRHERAAESGPVSRNPGTLEAYLRWFDALGRFLPKAIDEEVIGDALEYMTGLHGRTIVARLGAVIRWTGIALIAAAHYHYHRRVRKPRPQRVFGRR